MIESINHVSRDIAKQLNLDETLVKKINMFFWKEVKNQISSGEYTTVWMRGLGSMTVSRFKLQERIKRLLKIIRELKRETMVNQALVNKNMAELSLMLARRNEVAIQYKINADKAKAKRDAKILKTSLGKQTPDPTGNNKQDSQSSKDQEVS